MSGGVLLRLIILGVVLYVIIRVIYAVTVGNVQRRNHEARAAQIAGRLFDGSPAVTYVSPDDTGGVSLEALVAFANQHGYRLVQETGRARNRRVVFERRG